MFNLKVVIDFDFATRAISAPILGVSRGMRSAALSGAPDDDAGQVVATAIGQIEDQADLHTIRPV